MDKTTNTALMMALIYVGIILGAGFASGAEIMTYFAGFGLSGFFGLILSSSLFALVGYATWNICSVKNIYDYKNFMDVTMGQPTAKIMEAVLGLFMFIIFAAMLAAMGSALQESMGFNYLFSISALSAICFISFLFGISGIIKLNAYVSPILIVGCVFMAVLTFVWRDQPVFAVIGENADLTRGSWAAAAITYVSYNIIGAVVILPALKGGKGSAALKPALLSGLILFILGLSIYISLLANYPPGTGDSAQIPMLALAIRHSAVLTYIFMLLFLAACFTTAATNGYAVIATIGSRYKADALLLSAAVCLLGIIAAMAGFSNFVRIIYPLFALAGALEIILIIKYFVALKIKM